MASNSSNPGTSEEEYDDFYFFEDIPSTSSEGKASDGKRKRSSTTKWNPNKTPKYLRTMESDIPVLTESVSIVLANY